jgi:hypothetical protein
MHILLDAIVTSTIGSTIQDFEYHFYFNLIFAGFYFWLMKHQLYEYFLGSHELFQHVQNTSHQGSNETMVQKDRQTEWTKPGRVFHRNFNRGGQSRSSFPGKVSFTKWYKMV